jgi:hypothetical protein
MVFKLVVTLAALGLAAAKCPNSCSGHGTCNQNEVCTCHDNFGMGGLAGGDCSDRMCPYELAWVDAPEKNGLTHNYAECAAKGICDRSTGTCECFDGYEGKGCGRQVCENDCSGHGTCEYMNDLGFGTVYNDFYDGLTKTSWGIGTGPVRPATDYSWDADRARTCVCDAGWNGLSCADRMCPYGNDVLAERANTGVGAVKQKQTIVLLAGGGDGMGNYTSTAGAGNADDKIFVGKTFALQFTSKLNETYATKPIKIEGVAGGDYTSLNTKVQNALLELPHNIINGVTVTSGQVTTQTNPSHTGTEIVVEFTGTSVEGNQNLLEVIADPCSSKGCMPLITGITNQLITAQNYSSYVKETVQANFNSYECGRRGKCDVDTGICKCFEGYTAEACTELSALV